MYKKGRLGIDLKDQKMLKEMREFAKSNSTEEDDE